MKKKILAVSILLLAISMLFILTNTVKAATATIEKVESLSGGNVEAKDNVYTITLTKDDVNKLEWHAIDDPTYQEGVDRVANGWDVGFKVTFSEEITKGDLKAEYTDVEGITKTNPSCTPDTNPKEYSAWVSLNENKLEGKKETFQLAKFVFTIGTETKTVIINIDPTDVKLKVPEDGRMVKVTVYGYESTYEFTMEKDKTLSNNKENGGLSAGEVEDLEKLMTPAEGYKFVGLFDKKTGKEFKLDQVISADMELEVRFEKLPVETTPAEKDDTPKTGAVDVALIASVVAMVSVAGIVTVKKYSK